MSYPKDIDNHFTNAVLALEESIFEMDDIISKVKDAKKEDLQSAKKLACTARDLIVSINADINDKSKFNKKNKK